MTEHHVSVTHRATRFASFLVLCAFTALAQAAYAETDAASSQNVLLDVKVTDNPTVDGRSVAFDRSKLDALPQHEFKTSTIWTVGQREYSGPSLHDILTTAGVSGGTIHLVAANGYEVNMAWEEIEKTVPIVASKIDGAPFSLREKGPLWVVFPYDQDPRYRTEAIYALSIWQLTEVRVSE